TRQEKLDQLDHIEHLDANDQWSTVSAVNGEPFIPPSTDEEWTNMPLLADLFPWQQPGIKYNRMWPVAPSVKVLKRRWQVLLEDTNSEVRAEKFVTASTGRNIHTKVGNLDPIASLTPDADHP